jgi:uncharacterized alkaline shock family protein YloU
LLVTRRAIADIVRTATLGSYGVIGFGGSPVVRWLARLGLVERGIRVRQQDDGLAVELDLVVGQGLPVAEVARQVDAAVRHAVRQALDREIGRLAVHVQHLRFESGAARRPETRTEGQGTGPVASRDPDAG